MEGLWATVSDRLQIIFQRADRIDIQKLLVDTHSVEQSHQVITRYEKVTRTVGVVQPGIFFGIAPEMESGLGFDVACHPFHELEKFIKATDTLCRRFENWDIKMQSEEENEEDYIFDDSYNWHEPEK